MPPAQSGVRLDTKKIERVSDNDTDGSDSEYDEGGYAEQTDDDDGDIYQRLGEQDSAREQLAIYNRLVRPSVAGQIPTDPFRL